MINYRTVEPSLPQPTPPSCSDCSTKTEPAQGAPPAPSPSRMWRSSNGNMRIDTPQMSIITDKAGQKTILLDHLKKVAMIIPMPSASAPAPPGSPQMPGAGMPSFPAMQVHELGQSIIDGHAVEGKRYTLQPPSPPQAPQMPQPPQMPKAPQMPKLPQLPKSAQPPQLPQPPKIPKPTVAEVWSSVKLKIPVLTKVTTSMGEQTTYCKPTSTEEPHPSLFQVPAGYTLKNS
jgi:hypothetical protein